MKAKKLIVPTDGTQPAVYTTPLDNLISGNTTVHTATSTPAEPSVKRPASFNLDRNLVQRFKSACAQNGVTMSAALEEMMERYIQA